MFRPSSAGRAPIKTDVPVSGARTKRPSGWLPAYLYRYAAARGTVSGKQPGSKTPAGVAIDQDSERPVDGTVGTTPAPRYWWVVVPFILGAGVALVSLRLPVDELKIDQAFVVNLGPQGSAGMRTDRMIVRSVTALAHGLGLQVVAEGVENWQTYELPAALRCNVGQGYYLSRPMPMSNVAQWVRTIEFSPAASR